MLNGITLTVSAHPKRCRAAYVAMLNQVRPDGCVVANVSCPGVRRVLDQWKGQATPLGITLVEVGSTSSPLESSALVSAEVNSSGMTIASHVFRELGVAQGDIDAAVLTFPGVRRRMQRLGAWQGATLYDDYAHHPTAVRSVLSTLKNRTPYTGLFASRLFNRTRFLERECSLSSLPML